MVPLRRNRNGGFEEIPPTRCAGCGEPFRPAAVLVGVLHCVCAVQHRSHYCRLCRHVTLTPPAGEQCRPQDLDGRPGVAPSP